MYRQYFYTSFLFVTIYLLLSEGSAQSLVQSSANDVPELITMSSPIKTKGMRINDILSPEHLTDASSTIWHWLSPLPQGNTLVDVAAIDSNTIIAVGTKGTIIRTSDRGQTWAVSVNAANLDVLEKVIFINDTSSFVIGWYETLLNNEKVFRSFVLKSTNGGLHWRRVYNPIQQTQLTGAYFLNTGQGYIAGTKGFAAKTSDGGKNWQLVNTGTTEDFQSVLFLNTEIGFLGTRDGKLLRTSNGGSTWQTINLNVNERTVFSINFINQSTGFISGCFGRGTGQNGGFILKTTDAGLTWSQVFSNTLSQIYSIGFFGPLEGLAIGSLYSQTEAKYTGKVWKTTDGGSTWNETSNYVTKRRIFGSQTVSTSFVLAVTEGGVVLYSSNRGGSWGRASLEITDEDINDIQFVTPDTGFIACTNNLIYKTTNGGIDWTGKLLATPPGDISAFDFFSKTIGVAVNTEGKVFRTINGGEIWSATFNTTVPMYDVEFASINNVFCVGFADSSTGKLYRSTNGGLDFNEIKSFPSGFPSSVFFVDTLYGFITLTNSQGKGFLYRTTNGGQVWDSVPTVFSFKVFKSYFVNRNIGYIIGSDGRIAKTTNGGMLWSVDSLNNTVLSDIQFVNSKLGIVTSLNGRIFYTTDAGTTWLRSPAPSSMKYRAIQYVKSGETIKTYAAAQGGTLVISTVSPYNEKIWTWTGAADSSWFNQMNWSPKRIPDFTDSVVISSALRAPVLDRKQQQVVISALTIKENGRLIITDSIKTFVVLGDLTVDGRIQIKDSAKVQFIIGGSWDISPTAASNSSLGFDPGKSQVVFSKNGRIRSRFYDVLIDSGTTITSSGKLVVWNNLTMYYGNLDLNRQDTLVIQNASEDVFSGPGIVPNGTITRIINPVIARRYRFESEDTYLEFRETSASRESFPTTISFTTYPDTDPATFGTNWKLIPGRVDTLNNIVYADSLSQLGVFSFGTVSADKQLTRVKRVVTGGGGATEGGLPPFDLSIRYEQSEVPIGFDESQIRLLLLIDSTTSVENGHDGNPDNYSLGNNYPNPFNPVTKIDFSVPEQCEVTFTFFNALGEKVLGYSTGPLSPGKYTYTLDATHFTSGVYFYRMDVSGGKIKFSDIKKCILLK